MINATGTIINYYFHCKRQCWLSYHRINLEDNSEDVRIGKILHEINEDKSKKAEIKIDNIKVDKITNDYLVEIKKSDSDTNATKWQVILYLKKLKDRGIIKKGKIEYIESNKQSNKMDFVELNDEVEKELNIVLEDISNLLSLPKPPIANYEQKCKKCAYYSYCFC